MLIKTSDIRWRWVERIETGWWVEIPKITFSMAG